MKLTAILILIALCECVGCDRRQYYDIGPILIDKQLIEINEGRKW